MCVVSMVIDHYHDKWYPRIPPIEYPSPPTRFPFPFPEPAPLPKHPPVTDEEVEEFRKLLERAREYDKKNNEPDCELEEKKKKIKELADKLGVNVDFVDGKSGNRKRNRSRRQRT